MSGKNIMLKDGSGNDTMYQNVGIVSLPTADGGTASFYDADDFVMQDKEVSITKNGLAEIRPDDGFRAMNVVYATVNVPTSSGETEEVTVDLSMADGDQVITPSSGKSISKATVTKPSTLIPANIKKDVVIGGVTGTLDATTEKTAFITDSWSDDDVLCQDGFGIARIREHGIEIQIWSDITSSDMPLDTVYNGYFCSSVTWGRLSNAGLVARLSAFCEDIVTNHSAIFTTLFSGATKACFMDNEHDVDIPELSASTPATTDGFMGALQSTLSELPTIFEYGEMSPNDYGEVGTSSVLMEGEKVVMPFVWYPAVEDGEPYISHYILQEPTGTATVYEQGYKGYAWTGSVRDIEIYMELLYVNAMPSHGMSYNVAVMAAADGLIWWSAGEQTLSETLISSLASAWHHGDVVLSAGYNITTDIKEGANTTTPAPDRIMEILWLGTKNVPFDSMDDYEKSFFLGVTKQRYKRLNQNHVSIEFVMRNNTQ